MRSPPPERLRLVVWVTLVPLIALLAVGGAGGWVGIYEVRWRVASLVIVAIALAAWTLVAVRDPRWRPGTSMWPALGAALAAWSVSTLASASLRVSLEMLAWVALLVALYLLLRTLFADPFFRSRLSALSLVLCGVVCVPYLARAAALWIEWWGLVGRLTFPPLRPAFDGLTYGNPSPVAVMAVLLFAHGAAALGTGYRRDRLILGVLGVLVAATVVVAGSRGAWLATAVALPVTGIAWWATRRSGTSIPARRAVLAAGAVAIVLIALAPSFVARFAGGGGEALRAEHIAISARMFQDDPLTGSGPATWTMRRSSFTEPSELDFVVPYAHNVYAQTVAEFGLVGVAAGIVVAGVLGWLVIGALRSRNDPRRRFALAAIFAVTYLGIHQLFDSYANMPAVMFALGLTVARLDAEADEGERKRRPVGRLRTMGEVALVLAVIAAVGTLARIEAIAFEQELAVVALRDGDVESGLARSERVAAQDPTVPVHHFVLGLANSENGRIDEAIEAFQAAAKGDGQAETWLSLAALSVQLGDRPTARDHLERALRLGRQRAVVAVPAGGLWLAMGERERAVDAFAAAIVERPSLADDAYWSSTGELRQLWPSVLETAVGQSAGEGGVEIALLGGRTDEARQLAALLPPSRVALWEAVIAAWGGDIAARMAVEDLARADPLDLTVVGWARRLAVRADDEAAVARFGRWGEIVEPAGIVLEGYDFQVDSSGRPGSMPGSNSAFYGLYTYRRPVPEDLLVPGLPHLEVR